MDYTDAARWFVAVLIGTFVGAFLLGLISAALSDWVAARRRSRAINREIRELLRARKGRP